MDGRASSAFRRTDMAVAKPLDNLKKHITEEEFMRLPDDGRKYELVDGEAKVVPTSFEHDSIGVKVLMLIAPYAKGRGYMTLSQAGFRMKGGNIRCPDLSFTCKERLPEGPPRTFGTEAPDLCIEIISPSEEPADMERKLEEYFVSGAQSVWCLFPETQMVMVYTSATAFREHTAQEELDGGDLLPGFRCQVGELFTPYE
jgi:Uma2 family endonuclease